jgi:ABC-type multidrug transport system fused ATPase/permease subunit
MSNEIAGKLLVSQYDIYLKKKYSFHIDHEPATLLRSILHIPFDFSSGVFMPFVLLINEVLIVLIIIISIFVLNFGLCLSILCVIAPFFIFYNRRYKKALNEMSKEKDKLHAGIFKSILQTLEAIREIIVFDKLNYFKPLIKEKAEEYCKVTSRSYLIMLFSPKVVELFAVVSIMVIFLFNYFSGSSLNQLANILVLFAVALYRLIPSLNRIILSINSIRANAFTFPHFQKIKDDLILDDVEDEHAKPVEELMFKHSIQFDNLSFNYPSIEKPTLKNLDLTIKKGQNIGIVGPSGSGKSTFLNIILRLLNEQNGAVLVDGKKIVQENTSSWYKIISYVPQNIYLIEGDILSNIAFGVDKDKVDHDLVKYVIEVAQLTEFVSHLKNGVHTNIGDKGIKISGGQRQRIGIARALYNKAQILIFDEATSALDMETEIQVTESIRALYNKDLTIIIVAHRVQTLKYCDKIFKMEEGKLIEISSENAAIVNNEQ